MNFKNYAGYFRKYTPTLILATLLVLLARASEFTSTQILSAVVDSAKDLNFDFKIIFSFAMLLLAVEFVGWLSDWKSSRFIAEVKANVTRQIHWELGRKLADATPQTVKENSCVELSEKMREGNNFVESVKSIYDEIFTILLGIAALIYSAICSWKIATLFTFFFIAVLAIQLTIVSILVQKKKQASSASDHSKQLLVEILEGFTDVKSLNLAPNLKSYFSDSLDKESELSIQSANVQINNKLISRSILSLYTVTFLIFSAWLLVKKELTYGSFVALFIYKGKVYGLVDSVLRIIGCKVQIDVSTKRMDAVMQYQSVQKENFGTKKLYPVVGNLSIKNLCVTRGNQLVVDDVSIDIPAGTFVTIVGSTGCGKSTLLNAISKQVNISSGSILVDDIDVSELDHWSYRKAIAHVPQFPYFFSMSIKENLLLANNGASDERIKEVLDMCSARSFVEEKGGLDAVITPDQLSGGQQQRLALARIALRGGKILLLDETTSALDNATQDAITDTIRDAANTGHTVILVSHRIAPMRKADIILYMDKGKLVASGTFNKLYSEYPEFRELVDLS